MSLDYLIPRGYKPGGGLISPAGIFYLNIPKNASTYLTNVFADNSWAYSDVTDTNIKSAIVVLRDPVERWISGFATYAASWVLGNGYGSDHYRDDYNMLTERFIFDQIIFDDHTTEQVKFISQLPAVDITYFALNYELGFNLETYLDTKLDLAKDRKSNIGEDNYDTRAIAKHMRYQIDQNPNLKAKLVSKYSADYELINSAKFYYYDPR